MEMTAEEKGVYGPYYNGQSYVYGDPLAIHCRLYIESGGCIDQMVADAWSKDDDQLRARGIDCLYPVVVKAFQGLMFDPSTGEGLKADQAMVLIKDFVDWLSKKKVTTRT